MTRSLIALGVAVLALGAAGCNELSVPAGTLAEQGTTVAVPITLTLDAGVAAGGVGSTLTVPWPMTIVCADLPTATVEHSGTLPSPTGQSMRVAALAANIAVGWTNATVIYTCAVTVPVGTPLGEYPITLAAVGLADITGKTLSVKAIQGVIHVIS